MKQQELDFIVDEISDSRTVSLLTDLSNGEQLLLKRPEGEPDSEPVSPNGPNGPNGPNDNFPAPVIQLAQNIHAAGFSECLDHEGKQYFVQVYAPPLRVFIVGAVHISQVLLSLAEAVGYAATVIDPRRAFANEIRFPESRLMAVWPDEALATLRLDQRTAIVALSHDPKIDDPALTSALQSDAFYIGALGSRKTHQKRLNRLRGLGMGEASLKRIHSPVGLNIGSKTPEEIAVSIIGEIMMRLRRPES